MSINIILTCFGNLVWQLSILPDIHFKLKSRTFLRILLLYCMYLQMAIGMSASAV